MAPQLEVTIMKWLLFTLTFLFLTEYRSEDMIIQMKTEQMLYTSVGIRTNNGSGSGVIIASGEGVTLVLTAKHVIKNAKKPRIRVYPDETEYKATVIRRSNKYDLAILAFEGNHPFVAKLTDDLNIQVFEKIYKMGAGGGVEDPYPGEGIITGIDEDSMQINCGVVMGDSGGPLFKKDGDDYVLVGIITMVGMLQMGAPIYHVGLAHNVIAIMDFLSE